MHVLLRDDLGRLALRRPRPWHRMPVRCAAVSLDREFAAGTSPEASADLTVHGYLVVRFSRATTMMSPAAIAHAACRPAAAAMPASSEPNRATPRTLPVCRNAVSVPDATPERDGSTLPSRAEVIAVTASPSRTRSPTVPLPASARGR